MKQLSLILTVLLLACNAEKRATRYLNDHESFAAEYCATTFPMQDSLIYKVDTFIKAGNVDYTPFIERMAAMADSMQQQSMQDSIMAEINYESCKDVVNSQKKKIAEQASLLAKLRASYVPCKPDTVKVTEKYYTKDQAFIKMMNDRHEKDVADRDKYKAKSERRGKLNLWLIIALALIVGGWAVKTYTKLRIPFIK